MQASERLLANKERILSFWEKRVRQEIPAAARELQPVLIDTLPAILDQLAEALSSRHPRNSATEGTTVAGEHGGERVRLTHFRLQDLITEYQILLQVLIEVLEEKAPLAPKESATIRVSIDQALMEACTGYSMVQAGFRDQFFATVAHDLRNPLSVARGGASLILRKPSSETVPRWAARIIENIDRVDRMVQDLLDAMRVQTGARLQLKLEECELGALVRSTIDNLQAEFGERFVLVAPDPVRGHVAPDALRRAIENLATNAVKYGAPSSAITLTLRETHGRAILTVHNDGAHIPPAQQETLFRAFQRLTTADASGKRGWGLGLAQVRAVAEAHGGSIAVDSLPEVGTTFILDIPADARPFQDRPQTVPSETG